MQYAHFNNIGSSASRGLSGGSSRVRRPTTLVMEINAAYQLAKKKESCAAEPAHVTKLRLRT